GPMVARHLALDCRIKACLRVADDMARCSSPAIRGRRPRRAARRQPHRRPGILRYSGGGDCGPFPPEDPDNCLTQGEPPRPPLLRLLSVSVSWSPYPGVAFKRWIKAIGDLVMVLVVVTEADPIAAFRRLFSRVGFIL